MTLKEIKTLQSKERQECLDAILSSKSAKRLIVSGPGTGKTSTFLEVLKRSDGANLAMTFIRRLVDDMAPALTPYSEVKTFHAFCKKILHEQWGSVRLIPYLTRIIERDAEILEKDLKDFDSKFRMLDESGGEICFYLQRGNYYDAVSFDDSVYRLYKKLKIDPSVIPSFGQIVIDEYQDFNPLEVAFIEELEKKGPILIVGDDDQAVYDDRDASSSHLREKHASGDYTIFELPFCYRCTEVIVEATNSLISKANSLGHLEGRIRRRFECFIDRKEKDSIKYAKIVVARCSVAKTVAKYIDNEISQIDKADILESNIAGQKYPTVLIVGQRQYLREIEKQLGAKYPQLSYSPTLDIRYGIIEAYEELLNDQRSNLGWRIIVELFLGRSEKREIIVATEKGGAIVDLLKPEFVNALLDALVVIRKIRNKEPLTDELESKLRKAVGDSTSEIIEHFRPTEPAESKTVDDTQPTILLTSFKGCKGLSAGHVFIVGMNDGSMPKDALNIDDIEISQLIVALTRTRKQCHILSNKWLISPSIGGRYLPPFGRSIFISWFPKGMLDDRGDLAAKDFN